MKKKILKVAEWFSRFPKETPEKNKKRGRIATVVGTAAAALILFGAVSNPIGLAALYTIATISGVGAVSDGSKVKKNEETNGNNEAEQL